MSMESQAKFHSHQHFSEFQYLQFHHKTVLQQVKVNGDLFLNALLFYSSHTLVGTKKVKVKLLHLDFSWTLCWVGNNIFG